MLDNLKKTTMSCRKGFTKVTLNLIQGLPPELWPFRNSNNPGGRFQIKFGMTCLHNNHAFTLIELLVVVLIIGILSAVALPQYQKAVFKARATEMFVMIKSIREAQERYYLENNTYTKDMNDLDIDFPCSFSVYNGGEGSEDDLGELKCKNSVTYLYSYMVSSQVLDGAGEKSGLWINANYKNISKGLPGKTLCNATNATAIQLCKSWGGTLHSENEKKTVFLLPM